MCVIVGLLIIKLKMFDTGRKMTYFKMIIGENQVKNILLIIIRQIQFLWKIALKIVADWSISQ